MKLHPNLKSIGPPAGGGAVPAETKVILSSHNFDNTPSDKALETILQQMWASGADVAKIATTATDITDCARVLTLLKTSQGMPRYSLNVQRSLGWAMTALSAIADMAYIYAHINTHIYSYRRISKKYKLMNMNVCIYIYVYINTHIYA